ncbi:MAG: nickel pincer cofactor biosynthesis protein LarC [Actinomycetota bacterium]|nr:nickel pincer cofactor biosynthesis protein LarC [Actinomycetota bacterium]MDI7251759.1 nickel pincer cofactor biosynthesis protein LarC [Actinomycetota bacterium]
MKTLYLDAFAGISGDMMLGVLVDLGAPLDLLQDTASRLGLSEANITATRTERKGIGATKVHVRVLEREVVRTYAHIRELIDRSNLSPQVKERSQRVFALLAEAESRIHSRNIEQVHFHELGSADTLVDVVGSVACLEHLEVEELLCSPLPMGTGMIKTSHGVYPVPAPAVTEILRDVPVYSSGIPTEIVTPTGAAIVAALASDFCLLPPMRIQAVGYGAGDRDLEIPNVLRGFLGERELVARGRTRERRMVFSANIDDMNPEIYPYVMERLFEAGAEDVWLSPIQVKKSRPAVTISVLAPPSREEEIKEVIFAETKTLGIRIEEVDKEYLDREVLEVSTDYGPVRVKVARHEGRPLNVAPEYEDCRRAALRSGVPLKEVYAAAEEAARDLLSGEGVGSGDRPQGDYW